MLSLSDVSAIANSVNVKIKERKNGLIRGQLIATDGKKYRFRVSYGDDYVYLNIKTDHPELLEMLKRRIGAPFLRAVNRGITGTNFLYAWSSDRQTRDILLNSLTNTVSRGDYFGWQKVKRWNE